MLLQKPCCLAHERAETFDNLRLLVITLGPAFENASTHEAPCMSYAPRWQKPGRLLVRTWAQVFANSRRNEFNGVHKDAHRIAVEIADAPAGTYVLGRKRWERIPWIPCGKTLRAEQNAVSYAAPCMNCPAPFLQKPEGVSQGAQAFRNAFRNRLLLIVQALALACGRTCCAEIRLE